MKKFVLIALFSIVSVVLSFGIGNKKLLQSRQQCDPASSWLAYAMAPGSGNKVTSVNASWVVPSYPSNQNGGNAPGWWFGIEPEPACFLIQPILAWGYTGEDYSIFNGYYEWDDGEWWSSEAGAVSPGNHINAAVWYLSNNSYNMYIECPETGFSIISNIIAVVEDQTFTDTYFVVEHQPESCDQYPSNGEISFTNIVITIEGKQITPQWKAYTWQDDCNCQPTIVSSSEIQFTWDTNTTSVLIN